MRSRRVLRWRRAVAVATMTSKGQVTLPKPIRDALRLKAGDRVAFTQRPDGSVVLEPETLDAQELVGCLTTKTRVRGITIEKMEEVIRGRGKPE